MRKYRKGEPIKSLDEFLKQEFVMFHNKVYHSGWFRSWQINCVDAWIRQGWLFNADKITVKTVREDFFEKYPTAPKDEKGNPTCCPSVFGYSDQGCLVSGIADCTKCWSQKSKKS